MLKRDFSPQTDSLPGHAKLSGQFSYAASSDKGVYQ
jgi:hypothetical protein